MATPTLIQHVIWNNNNESGNAFILRLPNATLENNCQILKLYYTSSATLSSISGNVNSWSITPFKTVTDSGNNVKFSIFILPNATAGDTQITVTFTADVVNFNPAFQEWANIATSSETDGGAAQVATSTPVASGSFSTTVNGDLILHFGQDSDAGDNAGNADGLTKITKGSGYTLCQADLTQGYFCQYQVQGSFGATNPSAALTITAGAFDFCSITIALKSAAAGTLPTAGATRIFGLYHCLLIGSGLTGNLTYPVQFPFTGNAFFANCSDPVTSITLVTVSGAASGAWTTLSTTGASAQGCYSAGGTASTDEVLTYTLNDSTDHVYIQGCVYDIVNAAGFDTFQATIGSTGFGPGNSTPTVSFTPGAATGIVLNVTGIETGPPDSVVTPSGARFLSVNYTGETDLSGMDNGDFHGFYFYTSAAAQSWVFHNTANTAGFSTLLISFAGSSGSTNLPVIAWVT